MIRKILVLIILSAVLIGCRQQLINQGVIKLEKENILRHKRVNWRPAIVNANAEVYLEYGISEEKSEEIMKDVRDAFVDVTALFPNDNLDMVVTFFLVASDQTMKKITGHENEIMPYPKNDLAIIVMKESDEDKFEFAIANIISFHIWGPTHNWLHQGFSKYASVQEETNGSLYNEAAKILKYNSISLRKLMADYEDFDTDQASVLAGSFVEYLVKKQGLDLVKAIWKTEAEINQAKIKVWEEEWKTAVLKI